MTFTPYKGVGDAVVMTAKTTALEAGDPVSIVSGGVAVTEDATQLFGVAATDIAADELGAIWTKGVFSVSAAKWTGNVGEGTEMFCGGDGLIDAGTGGNPVAGVVVEGAATTAGGCPAFLITSLNANVK